MPTLSHSNMCLKPALHTAASSLPIFPSSPSSEKKKINNEKLEGGREERCLLCPLKGGHLLVVTQASLSESRPEPPAVPGSLGKGTAAGDPGRWGGFQTGQKQHFSSPPHGPFPCACGLSGGWYILFSEKYLN